VAALPATLLLWPSCGDITPPVATLLLWWQCCSWGGRVAPWVMAYLFQCSISPPMVALLLWWQGCPSGGDIAHLVALLFRL
jgi:hypothetical protein